MKHEDVILALEHEANNAPEGSYMRTICNDGVESIRKLMAEVGTLRAGLKAHGEEAAKCKPAKRKKRQG